MVSWKCILKLLIILIFSIGSSSAVDTVTVNLYDSAVLPCAGKCSGEVRWTESRKPTDILAECDQTSCRSVQKGYQMIYNQYLKGNLSLIITEADFSKRGLYTAECDGKYQCVVSLQIEAVNTTLQIQPGGSLLLDLDVSEPMEVIYSSTGSAGRSSGQICTVKEGLLQCEPEYSHEVSLLSAVELRDMQESDSGVYTVRDSRNEKTIHTYTVTVRDGDGGSGALDQEHKLSRSRRSAESNCPTCPECPESAAAGVPVWVVVVLVLLTVLLTVLLMAVLSVIGAEWIVKLKGDIMQRWNRSRGKPVQQNGDPRNGEPFNNPEQLQRLNDDTV